jgi:K+-transporting ATPase KdpF subunit
MACARAKRARPVRIIHIFASTCPAGAWRRVASAGVWLNDRLLKGCAWSGLAALGLEGRLQRPVQAHLYRIFILFIYLLSIFIEEIYELLNRIRAGNSFYLETHVSWFYLCSGLAAAGLFIYLFYVLIKPEEF